MVDLTRKSIYDAAYQNFLGILSLIVFTVVLFESPKVWAALLAMESGKNLHQLPQCRLEIILRRGRAGWLR